MVSGYSFRRPGGIAFARLSLGGGEIDVALPALPAYPGRMIRSGDGGFWLAMFAPRNPLVEFVLKEEDYRRRMTETIDPAYWIAPSLLGGTSFLEPIQGGTRKKLNMLKPWAPTWSGGLVAKCDSNMRPLESFPQPRRWPCPWRHIALRSRWKSPGRRQGFRTCRVASAAGSRCARMTNLIELKQVTKDFRGVPAIKDIDFAIHGGEIHAILGENGAGKSTLMKVMAGVYQPSAGTMLLDGKPIVLKSPSDALSQGIAMVYQETNLVPAMTVAQNIYLGRERLFNRLRGLNIYAQRFLLSLNFYVDPTVQVSTLGAGKKQMVEIARAVHHNARVIIFDEPTATLTPEEKFHFFNLARRLKSEGIAVIFISHALEEALQLSDRITVMRDSKIVITDKTSNFTRDRIVQAMVGRSLSTELYVEGARAARPTGEKILSVENLSMGNTVRNTSFSVFAGQVTGMFGLVGAGRTETMKIVAGVLKRDYFHGGTIRLRGKPIRYRTPRPAVKDGIVYVTEDRKIEGFFETMTIAGNIQLGKIATGVNPLSLVLKSQARKLAKDWTSRAWRQGDRRRCQGDRTLRWQPAEGRRRQGACAGAEGHHPRRADARRRCGDHRRDPSSHQPARR